MTTDIVPFGLDATDEEIVDFYLSCLFDVIFERDLWGMGDGYGGWVLDRFWKAVDNSGLDRKPPSKKVVSKADKVARKQGYPSALEATCYYCNKPTDGEARPHREDPSGVLTEDSYPTVDHVIPRDKGGTDLLENLVIACFACNRTKALDSEEEFRNRGLFSKRFYRESQRGCDECGVSIGEPCTWDNGRYKGSICKGGGR